MRNDFYAGSHVSLLYDILCNSSVRACLLLVDLAVGFAIMTVYGRLIFTDIYAIYFLPVSCRLYIRLSFIYFLKDKLFIKC